MNEEKILEWKALTMTKGMFKQIREVRTEEYQSFILLEEVDPLAPVSWIGYVIEPVPSSVGDMQVVWFIYEASGTLCRIRDMDIFWILRQRASMANDPATDLRDLLKQIFVKAW